MAQSLESFFADAGRFFKGVSDKFFGSNYLDQEAATLAYNRQIALDEMDRAWQEQMMDKMNWYNAPVNQMARLRAAGLNPSLVNGSPVAEAANSPGTSGSSAPQGSGGRGSGNLIQDLLSIKMASAQIDDLKASASLKQAQADSENQLRDSRIRNLDAATANLWQQNQDIISRIARRAKENQLTDAMINDISFNQMYKNNQLQIDWQRLANETKLTDAQVDKLKADMQLALAQAKVTEREYQEMVWTFAIRKAGLEANVRLTDAQIAQANATARKLGLDADLIFGDASFERILSDEAFNQGSAASLAVYLVQRAIGMFGHVLKL